MPSCTIGLRMVTSAAHLTPPLLTGGPVTLKALAQIGDQVVVSHELPIVAGNFVRRERLEAFRRRHVDAPARAANPRCVRVLME
jgi:hypothetical protein